MQDQLKSIREHVAEELKNIQDTGALEQLRVRVLGKKGELTAILRGMGKLPAEERPKMGQIVNETRAMLENAIDQAESRLEAALGLHDTLDSGDGLTSPPSIHIQQLK